MCARGCLAFVVVLAASVEMFCRPASAETTNISSGPGWEVSNSAGNFVGLAANVCLQANTPANCPLSATPPGPAVNYGYPLGGWTANLAGQPDPHWIWAPGITGATRPAENQEYIFESTFLLCSAPRDSDVWLSADNRADVFVNGTQVLNNANNAVLDRATVPAALLRMIPFTNTLRIVARNDPNPANCGDPTTNLNGPYSCNPAGVVFNGRFEDTLDPWPRCAATRPPTTATYHVGETEDLGPCPAGWSGSRFHQCGCAFDATGTVVAMWGMPVNTCTPPPPPRQVCLDFDALAPTDTFGQSAGHNPGDRAFTAQGVSVSVEMLTGLAVFGDVVADTVVVGSGSNRAIRFQNAALRFDFANLGFTPGRISMEVDYKGGRFNFATDTSTGPVARRLLARPSPSPMPNIGASAVTLAQAATVSGGTLQAGKLTLTGGQPRWLEIGGQELWIDDLCLFE